MCACKLFASTQARFRVVEKKKKKTVCILDRVPCRKSEFSLVRPHHPYSHHRAIFPGEFSPVSSAGARLVIWWSVPLKQPATGFNLQVGLFRASQTRRLPALAGNSQFPANSAISCCVRPPRNVGRMAATSYFVRPSFKSGV